MDQELKREILLENYSNPFHKETKDGFLKANANNISCIDDINVFIKIEDNKIVDAYFDGEACAISTASTSIMIKKIIGMINIRLLLNDYLKDEIANFVAGQSPKSEFYSANEGIPFLQGNRTFGMFYPKIDTYTTKTTKIAHEGDILMSVRAPVGDLNFAPCELCIGRGLSV